MSLQTLRQPSPPHLCAYLLAPMLTFEIVYLQLIIRDRWGYE